MRFQRLAAATVTIVAIIGLGGCGASGSAEPDAAVTTPASADPLAEFVAASKRLSGETMRMKMTMPGVMESTGTADLKNRKLDMVMSISAAGQSMEMATRLVGDTMFLKYGPADGKWMRLDVSKLPAGSQLNPENMANAEAFAQAAVKVEKGADGSFSGTLDMTKSPTADPASLKALGDKATAVPFTARADNQGRLVELTIDMSGLGAGATTMTTTYSDFGTPVTVEEPPAAEVTEMPADMLKIFTQQTRPA